MMDFLIKSTLSMALLLAVYLVFLSREKMHRFNRFYLLASLVFSIALPFINIRFQNAAIAQPITGLTTILLSPLIISNGSTNYLPYIMWAIYGVVTLLLLLRFANNLLHFKNKVSHNPTLPYKGAVLVLVPDNVLPHTFLNYIFINKQEHEAMGIEGELYTHELAHAYQKHTLDVLFIELLKTLLWFNPLLYFYKKAIQLNHEFLADETVVNAYYNVITYQKLLVEKAAHSVTFSLASNLNFAITKKRLLMMTKTTPRLLATVKQLAIVPLFAGLLLVSCADETTTKDAQQAAPESQDAATPGAKEVLTIVPDSVTAKHSGAIVDLAKLSKQPEYPGGMTAFYKYVGKNFKVPEELNGSFRLYVSFVVEKDGSLTELTVLRDGAGHGAAEEAIRVLQASAKWAPGEVDGQPVRTSYKLPITLNVTN